MEKWSGKVAVVTGASSGIGASLVVDLAKAGITVVGLARRVDRVQAIADEHKDLPGKIHAHKCDISVHSEIKETFKWIEETFHGVDILVNNAGKYVCTDIFTHEDNSNILIETIQTNLTGLVLCSQEAFRSMSKRDTAGYIININSVSGHMYTSKAEWRENVYAASKHGVTSATEIMRTELVDMKNKKIRVSSISPGYVRTEIFKTAGLGDDLDEILGDTPCLSPEDVSDAVMYLLSTKPHVHIKELTIQPVGEVLN